MTREEYYIGKRLYKIFGWVLLAEFVGAFIFWAIIINHLNPKK